MQAAGQRRTSKAQKEAEACFLHAIDLARQQQAKSLELRAQISLSHLWKKQRKIEQVRTKLTEICGAFTQGMMTEDYIAATSLLSELNKS